MASYELVTVNSPHMRVPVKHGTWPTQAEAERAARSLVKTGELAEIRQKAEIRQSFRVVARVDKTHR